MINRDRLVELFTELVETDSPSLGERDVCDKLKEKLAALGINSYEDDTAAKIGGNAGNLYAYVDGSIDLKPILLSAHMDIVEPSKGKSAILHGDGTITSDGTTVLGADDLSGIAVILEVLTVLKERDIPHRPIEVLFDVSEETYCIGIQQFNFPILKSKEAYVLDLSGPVGTAAFQAPSIVSFRAEFHGWAAHAAFSPEAGIHAIKAAAKAVTLIRCGRIGDTTVNVGKISGGSADNVVPEYCTITGEVRGFNDVTVRKQLAEIETRANEAAKDFGAEVYFTTETLCLAYRIDETEPVTERFLRVCADAAIESSLVSTYGGSDNNHFFHHGIRGLVVASGMNNCHSCAEYTSISELEKAARLVLALVLSNQ